jgi:hypothetical protein
MNKSIFFKTTILFYLSIVATIFLMVQWDIHRNSEQFDKDLITINESFDVHKINESFNEIDSKLGQVPTKEEFKLIVENAKLQHDLDSCLATK